MFTDRTRIDALLFVDFNPEARPCGTAMVPWLDFNRIGVNQEHRDFRRHLFEEERERQTALNMRLAAVAGRGQRAGNAPQRYPLPRDPPRAVKTPPGQVGCATQFFAMNSSRIPSRSLPARRRPDHAHAGPSPGVSVLRSG